LRPRPWDCPGAPHRSVPTRCNSEAAPASPPSETRTRHVHPLSAPETPEEFIDAFCRSLYTNPHTRQFRRKFLRQLFAHSGATAPDHITPQALVAWITSTGANNTIRSRLATARVFFRWATREGLCDQNPAADLSHITKSFPATYGKIQSRYPARWLTYEEAYGQLLATCDTTTARGLRDALAVRLGLCGMRANEIRTLTFGHLHLSGPQPTIVWTGKGGRPRTLTPGPTLTDLLHRWTQLWREVTGRLPRDDHTLIARAHTHGRILFGSMCGPTAVFEIVTWHAQRAGLGRVSPHDLRRSAAGILHNTTALTAATASIFSTFKRSWVTQIRRPRCAATLIRWTLAHKTERHPYSTDGFDTHTTTSPMPPARFRLWHRRRRRSICHPCCCQMFALPPFGSLDAHLLTVENERYLGASTPTFAAPAVSPSTTVRNTTRIQPVSADAPTLPKNDRHFDTRRAGASESICRHGPPYTLRPSGAFAPLPTRQGRH
jgi:integrase